MKVWSIKDTQLSFLNLNGALACFSFSIAARTFPGSSTILLGSGQRSRF